MACRPGKVSVKKLFTDRLRSEIQSGISVCTVVNKGGVGV